MTLPHLILTYINWYNVFSFSERQHYKLFHATSPNLRISWGLSLLIFANFNFGLNRTEGPFEFLAASDCVTRHFVLFDFFKFSEKSFRRLHKPVYHGAIASFLRRFRIHCTSDTFPWESFSKCEQLLESLNKRSTVLWLGPALFQQLFNGGRCPLSEHSVVWSLASRNSNSLIFRLQCDFIIF